MKRALWALVLGISCACGASAAEEGVRPFGEGNRHYQAGRYEQAASSYRKAIADGGAGAAAHYNLGNAYFRLGQKGKALASYERARRLDPRDPDVEWNRRLLQGMLVDRIVDPAAGTPLGWANAVLEKATADEWALAVCLLLTVWALCVLGGWLAPLPRLWRWLGAVSLVLFFAAAAGFVYGRIRDQQPLAVVLDKEVFVRYGPSENERKAFLLHEGAVARVGDRSRDWIYLTLPDRNGGWVPAASCEEI